MAQLPELMRSVSSQMLASLQEARIALTHNATIGDAAETAVREFLRQRLPLSVGVGQGQIIDRYGNTSPQCDVVLYDALNTPVLWMNKERTAQLFPSEGVIAVLEVKSKISGSDATEIVAHMDGVKSLDKSAYQPSDSNIIQTKYVHGTSYELAPTLYFVLTFDSSSIENLLKGFTTALNGRAPDKRIDSIYSLAAGVLMWRDPATDEFDAVPKPGDEFVSYPTQQTLLMFTILTLRYLTQLGGRVPDLQGYLPDDFVM